MYWKKGARRYVGSSGVACECAVFQVGMAGWGLLLTVNQLTVCPV